MVLCGLQVHCIFIFTTSQRVALGVTPRLAPWNIGNETAKKNESSFRSPRHPSSRLSSDVRGRRQITKHLE